MSIDNMMFLALGALLSALVALLIFPAIWRRAVRLTRKRIEAATPMSMAEFRADKDQLRAEFALSTRRLEANVEALRKRLTEQLGDINRKRSDLSQLKTDREQHTAIVRELEEREADARRRVLELEKEAADLSQRLRMRDRELAEKSTQLLTARETMRGNLPSPEQLADHKLSGEYDHDVDALVLALSSERKRSGFLDEQVKALMNSVEAADRRTAEAQKAASELNRLLQHKESLLTDGQSELLAAEARIANAEARLNALLSETRQIVDAGQQREEQLLAEKLSLDDELAALRTKVTGVEAEVLADWDGERIEQAHLRERLNDIAADVSRLVLAMDGEPAVDLTTSLFERVQKFAGPEAADHDDLPARGNLLQQQAAAQGRSVAASDRLAALRELQERG